VATTRVFRSGNSQAVRLPKQFQFRGNEVVLREKSSGMDRAFELLANMAIDVDAIEQARKELPQSREEL
jgi:antitoxin VapB